MSGFQPEDKEDGDPEATATKGISTHPDSIFFGVGTSSAFGTQYTGMTVIFQETLEDLYSDQAQRLTVAHEMAHTLGADHAEEGLMHQDQQTSSFSEESIRELRDYVEPE